MAPPVKKPIIDSVVISPQSAVAGTLRIITINAHDQKHSKLTYACFVDGQPATHTGQPNVFTVVA